MRSLEDPLGPSLGGVWWMRPPGCLLTPQTSQNGRAGVLGEAGRVGVRVAGV